MIIQSCHLGRGYEAMNHGYRGGKIHVCAIYTS